MAGNALFSTDDLLEVFNRESPINGRRPRINMLELIKDPVTQVTEKPWDRHLEGILRNNPHGGTLICVNSWEQVEFLRRIMMSKGHHDIKYLLGMSADITIIREFDNNPGSVLVLWPEDPAGMYTCIIVN